MKKPRPAATERGIVLLACRPGDARHIIHRARSRGGIGNTMKAALDVGYEGDSYRASCVIFQHWDDAHPVEVVRVDSTGVMPYRPGRFYERELPCLLAVLHGSSMRFDTVVIDGYVDLAGNAGRGLGRRLYEELGRKTTVIGVAKSPLTAACGFVPVLRGSSVRPVYVSCAGRPVVSAVLCVLRMHGLHRIPTLLTLAHRRAALNG